MKSKFLEMAQDLRDLRLRSSDFVRSSFKKVDDRAVLNVRVYSQAALLKPVADLAVWRLSTNVMDYMIYPGAPFVAHNWHEGFDDHDTLEGLLKAMRTWEEDLSANPSLTLESDIPFINEQNLVRRRGTTHWHHCAERYGISLEEKSAQPAGTTAIRPFTIG